MKKVLIIGPQFRDFLINYKTAFESNGYDADVLSCVDFPSRLEWYVAGILFGYSGLDKIMEREREKFADRVISTLDTIHYDCVFVINGDYLLDRALESIKSIPFRIIYLFDTLAARPTLVDKVKYFNYIFSFQKSDAEYIRKNAGKDVIVEFMPASYSDKTFKILNGFSAKDRPIDISFVGIDEDNRKEILSRIIADFPNLNIEVYGRFFKPAKPLELISWIFSSHKVWKNVELSPGEVCKLYNRSKIVLNLSCQHNKTGWSSRLLEIGASGALCISLWDSVSELYFGKSVRFFRTYEELSSLISYYICNDEERIDLAQRFNNDCSDYTDAKFIKSILDYCRLTQEKNNFAGTK